MNEPLQSTWGYIYAQARGQGQSHTIASERANAWEKENDPIAYEKRHHIPVITQKQLSLENCDGYTVVKSFLQDGQLNYTERCFPKTRYGLKKAIQTVKDSLVEEYLFKDDTQRSAFAAWEQSFAQQSQGVSNLRAEYFAYLDAHFTRPANPSPYSSWNETIYGLPYALREAYDLTGEESRRIGEEWFDARYGTWHSKLDRTLATIRRQRNATATARLLARQHAQNPSTIARKLYLDGKLSDEEFLRRLKENSEKHQLPVMRTVQEALDWTKPYKDVRE